MSRFDGFPDEGLSSIGTMPADWRAAITPRISITDLSVIEAFVAAERARTDVYPPADDVFAALRLTPIAALRAVIVGQDPYHQPGQAHGLAFSVPDVIAILPSLRNIRTELHDDLGLALPPGGSLVPWARSGVLLLNTALTVRRGEPGSHANEWASLTDAIIRVAASVDHPVAFLLWGRHAKARRRTPRRCPRGAASLARTHSAPRTGSSCSADSRRSTGASDSGRSVGDAPTARRARYTRATVR